MRKRAGLVGSANYLQQKWLNFIDSSTPLAIDRRVDAELVRVLYREAMFGIIATAAVSTSLAIVMASALHPALVAGWLAITLVLYAGRWWLVAPLRGSAARRTDLRMGPAFYGRRFLFGLVLGMRRLDFLRYRR